MKSLCRFSVPLSRTGQEGKEGKDTSDLPDRIGPSGKLDVETTGVFELYAQIGVTRFNPYAEEKFPPLV